MSRGPRTLSWWPAGLAVALWLLAPPTAAPAQDAAAGAPAGAGIGVPVNQAEVRDTALGAPLPSDRAPFTPPATSELGAMRNGADPVRALPTAVGLRLGRNITLSPFYRGAVFYDSNVFRDQDDQAVDDVELTSSVGVDLTIVRRRLELEAGYTATRREYVDLGQETTEHRARLRLAAVGRVVSTRLRADLGILSRPDDPRFNQASVDRYIYDLGAAMAIRLTRTLSLVPEVFGSMQDYRDIDFDYADNLTYGANVLVGITPRGRVTFVVGGGVREQLYTDDAAIADDLRIFSVITGMEVRFLRSLTGQVRVGYDWSEVIDARDIPDDSDDPPSGLVTSANLRWQAVRGTAFTFDASRQITFTTGRSPVFTTRFGVGVEQALLPGLAIFARASYEDQDPVDGDQGDLSSVFLTAGTAWSFRPWLQLGADVSYLARASNSSSGGDFDVLRVGAALTLRY